MTGPFVVVFVGGGPRTVSLIERLAASAEELLPAGLAGEIHVVDPFPAGGGRIWRRRQSPLLWMNSTAADVTIFTDVSVTCAGPIVTGPSLAEWLDGAGRDVLVADGLGHLTATIGPDDFPPREVQASYLGWAFRRAVRALPARIRVTVHEDRAAGVRDLPDGRQLVDLLDGDPVVADVVVLAQGYLDRRPTPDEASLAERSAAAGLTYLPPGYTADLDLSALLAGEPVLVRGFGLAFIDLMVLIAEGRGGRFSTGADGVLRYHPSGREPVLHVGSRRGVPYHAKLGYAIADGGPVAPRYFTPDALALAGAGPLDFRTVLWPLIVKELAYAHYQRLFAAHPGRTTVTWDEFAGEFEHADVTGSGFAAFAELAVPKPEDRFDVGVIDRPLAGRRFRDHADLAAALTDYVSADLDRRRDPYHSADRAVFDRLLSVYGVLAGAITAGRVSAVDRITYIEGEFHGFFSFLASGPPPRRLAELLALHRAGIVEFAGPELRIDVVDGQFHGTSPAVPQAIRARALIDARLPRPDVRAATDPVIRGLLADRQLVTEELLDAAGLPLPGGQLLADATCRAIRADRSVHPRRFLLGPSVSGSAGAAGFSRPRFNGPGFRQNDAVARDILRLLHTTGDPARSDAANSSAADPTPTQHGKVPS